MAGNPYEAPVEAEHAFEAPVSRFRWRVVFVSLVGGFGGIFVVGGVAGFVIRAIEIATGESRYQPPGAVFEQVMTGGLVILSGFWLLWAARIWWRGRWKTALAMCVSLYAVGLLIEAMAGRL